MLRAHLTDVKRCYLHQHRVVLTACARCKTAYCDECLETRDDGLFAQLVQRDEKKPAPLFCARCVDEIQALTAIEAERKRPLHQRLRPTRDGTRRFSIGLAVVAVIMVPMWFAVRDLATTEITPEELGRIRLALGGGFRTPDGINLVSHVFGGEYVRASGPSQPGHEPSRLIDTWATREIPGWRAAEARFPIDLVFQLPQPQTITTVILRPHPSEPPETWVRDFEIHVSPDAPDKNFTRVFSGRVPATAAGRPAEASFTFDDVTARFVMLRVLDNHGSVDYTSLAELEVYWSPAPRR